MNSSPEKAKASKDAHATEDGEKSDMKGQKRPAKEVKEDIANKVSSPNDWEHADLGDAGRKNKFLRLMGAAKKEHHGKIVIGDQPEHKQTGNVDKINYELEQQFQHGMEHKLKGGTRRHLGLGFQSEEDETNKEKTENNDSESSQGPPENSKLKEDSESRKTKEASPEKDNSCKVAGFVKGSS
ncbi:small acidic protein-like [Lingula anatina]|uniref:Small acidic protein n=1 Tax=Lingula anatina TaxID=7574 RepID=A0A1S3HC80_LINAN|nr:small acidic protein-like [Lingula anatina]|eukprot:XP_013383605.1 small acidic protein-like [Lingula anatina]